MDFQTANNNNDNGHTPGKGMRLLQAIFLVAVTIQALANLHDRFIKGREEKVKTS